MNAKRLLAASSLAILALLTSTASFADSKAAIDQRVDETLKQFHALNGTHAALQQKAAGILVFPRVIKAGAGVAGEYGEGALQAKGKTVAYYSLTSASVGLTLGVAKHSELLLFMTQKSLDDFIASKGWSIGVDTGVAMVKKGAGGDYDSDTLKKSILGFVISEEGLIADVSLEGSKINKISPK